MRPLLLSIYHSTAAQFALTHGERIRGGMQLNIMPISYVSNTNYGDISMMFFTARERGRGLSGVTKGLSSTTRGLSDLDP